MWEKAYVEKKEEKKLEDVLFVFSINMRNHGLVKQGLRDEIKVALWSARRHEKGSERGEKRILGT